MNLFTSLTIFKTNSYAQKRNEEFEYYGYEIWWFRKVCQEETVLIKKEFIKNFETRSFMIYTI